MGAADPGTGGPPGQAGPSAPSGRATLKTIAELTGLHVSTVSRVLNGTSSGARAASAATAERVRQVAREVGYVPDIQAAGLRRQTSRLLGVMMARLTDQVLASIYEGVERAATRHGFHTMVSNSWDDPATREAHIAMLLSRRVDAMIFGDAHVDGRFVAEFATHGVPFVLVNRRAGDHPSVTCDDLEGGRLAAEHLHALGHRRVGVVAGLPYAANGLDRTSGFTRYFAERGHPVPGRLVVHASFDAAGGALAAARLLDHEPRLSAIFAVSDFAAIGVLGLLRERGLRAGQDVAVVGFNDVPIAAQLTIPLSSVRSPMCDVGAQGVDLLVRMMRGEPPERIMLPPELRVRESSARPYTDA
ncbi:LacI family DNA-binding transcriptional regulator [Actinomadura rubrisoli]|uniref:LacI family DNA-binding transcriptional regulator n=1 Tax=Actinomadura rubrisoli TaxID=2530368 RepID=A0A4V2YYP4_9ACTN|nr:LacI family DNA-binding transcriptional regulator [Actinomadura rubrisoli]